MCFAGPAVTLPLVLTYAGRGGQVILSEQAWDSVKPVITQHPGAVSIISLGMHVLSDDFPTPMLLMEVMPNLLARRNFNKIMTKRLVEPGFREAPDPREPMTVVFVKVGCCLPCAWPVVAALLLICRLEVSVCCFGATTSSPLCRQMQ